LHFVASKAAYVSLANHIPLRDTDDFTIAFWYRGTESRDNGYFGRTLIGTGASDIAANIQIATHASDPNNIGKVEFRHLGGGDVVRSTSRVTDGRWHHIAYINHGATVTGDLYIDGRAEVTGAGSNNRDDWDAAGYMFYVSGFMRGYSLTSGEN